MISWIIYNGSNEIQKVNNAAFRFEEELKKLNIETFLLKNTDIIMTLNNFSDVTLEFLTNTKKPDFIIFWDKDILLASFLEKKGYKVFNSSDAIKKCDNKTLTLTSLLNKNIPMPKTIFGPFSYYNRKLDKAYFNAIVEKIGIPFVLKESYGSFGMQVYLIQDEVSFFERINIIENKSFLIQEFIKGPNNVYSDIRVNIIGDEVFGAMMRTNHNDFRANISNGGIGTIIALNDSQKKIALLAHKSLGLTFSGVDLLINADGNPILCEVNSNVNFISYETLSGKNFAKDVIDYILKSL